VLYLVAIIIIIMKAFCTIIVTLYIKNVTGALYTVNYNENTLWLSTSHLCYVTDRMVTLVISLNLCYFVNRICNLYCLK